MFCQCYTMVWNHGCGRRMDLSQDIKNFICGENDEYRSLMTIEKRKGNVLTIKDRKLLFLEHSRWGKYQLLQQTTKKKKVYY